MADDRDARIAQLEAEVAALREREALLVSRVEQRDGALVEAHEQQTARPRSSVPSHRRPTTCNKS